MTSLYVFFDWNKINHYLIHIHIFHHITKSRSHPTSSSTFLTLFAAMTHTIHMAHSSLLTYWLYSFRHSFNHSLACARSIFFVSNSCPAAANSALFFLLLHVHISTLSNRPAESPKISLTSFSNTSAHYKGNYIDRKRNNRTTN